MRLYSIGLNIVLSGLAGRAATRRERRRPSRNADYADCKLVCLPVGSRAAPCAAYGSRAIGHGDRRLRGADAGGIVSRDVCLRPISTSTAIDVCDGGGMRAE